MPLQNPLNIRHHLLRLHLRSIEPHNPPIPIHQKLPKIPRDFRRHIFLLIMKLTIDPQELIKRVSLWPINLYFREERECRIELLPDEQFDLLFGAALLLHELVAREGEDLEAFGTVLLVEVGELFVVGLGETACAGDINKYHCFCSSKLL